MRNAARSEHELEAVAQGRGASGFGRPASAVPAVAIEVYGERLSAAARFFVDAVFADT